LPRPRFIYKIIILFLKMLLDIIYLMSIEIGKNYSVEKYYNKNKHHPKCQNASFFHTGTQKNATI